MQNNQFTEKMKETSPVPERISPENIEKKIYDTQRSKISLRKRVISAAAAMAIIAGGTAGYLYGSGFFDKKSSPIKTSSSSQAGKLISSSLTDDGSSSAEPGFEETETIELTGLQSLSYDELNDFLKENCSVQNYYSARGIDRSLELEMNDETAAAEADAAPDNAKKSAAASDTQGTSNANADHSETYTQEKGIDEADIVKTDGKNIFYLAGGNIFAVDCDNGKMEEQLIDFTKLYGEDYKNSTAQEMYLDGGTLTVVLQSQNPYRYTYWIDETREKCEETQMYKPTCNVVTFNVKDINNITPSGKYTIQGSYSNSRMVDGKLYLTVMSGINYYDTYDETGVPEFAPVYTVNGESHYISSGDIFVPTDKIKENYGCTTVSLIDTNAQCRPVSIKAALGYTHEIYQCADRLVLTGTFADSNDDKWTQYTRLTMFDTKDGTLAPMASTLIEGSLKDRYSLDYENGVLRAVIGEQHYDEIEYKNLYNNYLYTLDDKLETIGKSESFGDNEVIKSVTFEGSYAYVVTFMQTDPLFAIDLSDPKNPTIVSELKMPGFSTHMRAFTEGRLVGFGNTAEEEHGRVTGLKLSVYDNSDPNDVKELDKVELIMDKTTENSYHYISSPATYDEKALLIDGGKNIIAFPYTEEEYTYYYNDDKDDMFNIYTTGYKFYSYTDDKGLQLVGEYKDSTDVYKYTDEHRDEDYYYYDLYKQFTRAIYIGDVYYLFNDCGIVSVSADSFEVIDTADLKALAPDSFRRNVYVEYDDYVE